VRARLGLGLLGGTPYSLRAFLGAIAPARAADQVTREVAGSSRADGRRLLRDARRLRAQLHRLLARRETFVP
jgi:hypothetical protein